MKRNFLNLVRTSNLPLMIFAAALLAASPATLLAQRSHDEGGRNGSYGRGGDRAYSGRSYNGGGGRAYSGGRSYNGTRDRAYSGRSYGEGQRYANRTYNYRDGGRFYGDRDRDGGRFYGDRDRDRGRFFRGGFGFRYGYGFAPYAYGYSYGPGYCDPAGYYDGWGRWIPYPGCAVPYGY